MLALSFSEEEVQWRNMVGALYGYYSNQEKELDYVKDGKLMIPLWMYYKKWWVLYCMNRSCHVFQYYALSNRKYL